MSPVDTAPVFRATASREALAAALAAVVPTIGMKGVETMPVLQAVKLTLVPGGMTATSNSLDATTTVRCAAEHDAVGAVCLVPARKFAEMVRELPPAPIKLALENHRLVVECASTRYVISTLGAPEEFPATPMISGPSVTFPAERLHDLAKHVSFAASTEESRPALRGVRLELETEGRVTAVATNGHRMAVARQEGEQGGAGVPSVTIPPSLLDHATRMFSPDEVITLTVDALHNQVSLEGACGTLTARTVDVVYPSWQHVIPTDNDIVATVDTRAFLESVKRVATVASDQTRRVKLAFESGLVKISAETADLGESMDELAIQYSGPPLAIGFNATYLIELLTKLGSEEAVLLLKAPERAMRVMPAGAEPDAARVTAADAAPRLESLLMPLRLVG